MLYTNEIKQLIKEFDSFGILEHTLPNAIGMWKNEQECLLWLLLNADKNYNWIEIGSFCGGSTVLMCLAHRFVKAENKIISVDINYNPMFDINVYDRGKFQNIHIKQEINSSTFANLYSGEPISFAFIDGFHSFKQVIIDFKNIQPFLTPNAIILFHDVSPFLYDTKYTEKQTKYTLNNYDKLMESNVEDFSLDEAILFICNKYKYQLLDIPVKTQETHFKETKLNCWVKGTTSPFNSLGAIQKCV